MSENSLQAGKVNALLQSESESESELELPSPSQSFAYMCLRLRPCLSSLRSCAFSAVFLFPFLFQFTQFSFLCSFWGGNCCNALKSFIKTTKWNWVPEPEPERMFSRTSRLGFLGCKSIWPLAAALDWSEDTHTDTHTHGVKFPSSLAPPRCSLRQHICSFIYVLTA